jgi:hypothetical protein
MKSVCCANQKIFCNIWFVNKPEPTKLNHTPPNKEEALHALENVIVENTNNILYFDRLSFIRVQEKLFIVKEFCQQNYKTVHFV